MRPVTVRLNRPMSSNSRSTTAIESPSSTGLTVPLVTMLTGDSSRGT